MFVIAVSVDVDFVDTIGASMMSLSANRVISMETETMADTLLIYNRCLTPFFISLY